MSIIQKIIASALGVIVLGASGYFISDYFSKQNNSLDTPEKIVSDYKDLLAEAEQLKALAGNSCDNKKDINQKIESLEKKLADLAERKKQWLDNVPKLPDVEPEILDQGRPGSEVPELTPDVPPLPEIDEINIIDPNENIFQIENCEQKINNILQQLKTLCQDEESAPKPVSDKCSDACQRYKSCASFTEDVTPADLNDAYNTCMEECATWPKEMIKCINAINIKVPNDCVSFVQCQLPQFYEEKYLK